MISIDDVKDVMAKYRHRDFPVIDKDGKLLGMISRRKLLGAKKKSIILVDHNEKSQAVDGIEDAEILENHRSSPDRKYGDDQSGLFPERAARMHRNDYLYDV